MRIKIFILIFCITASLKAQTTLVWFPILSLSGNMNVLITSQAPVTYRYGTNFGVTNTKINCATPPGCWLAPITATLTNFPTLFSTFPSDPAPGISKEFDIAESSTAQILTVGGSPITVPPITTNVATTSNSPTFAVVLKGTTYQCTNIALSNAGVLTITCN